VTGSGVNITGGREKERDRERERERRASEREQRVGRE